MPTSYPFQPELRVYPPNVPDASDSGDLLSHDDLAPLLNEWMSQSDRISTQVVGQSTQGRDLYLVTLTAPEHRRETSRQSAWRDEIRDDPAAADRDRALQRDYKQPIWFSANIHGNEWEGTDASMQVIEDLVEAPWPAVRDLLEEHRIYFSLTLNPDGRTAGTRATALGLNENRDMITNTTPEATSFVRTAAAIQPLSAADLHGYTGVLQVEPCGPPHGENYEYDLFIPHGYAMARQVEDDVVAADIPGNTYYNITTGEVVDENTGPDTAHIAIPYRDIPSGWDDYPPIFTAQYAAFFGAITSTVELPLSRPTGSTQSPENARINTAVAKRTIESIVDYVDDNGSELLDNQIEMFRRGVAGEPKDSLTEADVAGVEGPDEWKPLWDVVDDQDPVQLPRAYVIPAGEGQRSSSDAENLVRQLLLHEIEVGVLQRPGDRRRHDVPARVVRRGHAPAAARAGQLAARPRVRHLRQGADDVRHLGVELLLPVGRDRRQGRLDDGPADRPDQAGQGPPPRRGRPGRPEAADARPRRDRGLPGPQRAARARRGGLAPRGRAGRARAGGARRRPGRGEDVRHRPRPGDPGRARRPGRRGHEGARRPHRRRVRHPGRHAVPHRARLRRPGADQLRRAHRRPDAARRRRRDVGGLRPGLHARAGGRPGRGAGRTSTPAARSWARAPPGSPRRPASGWCRARRVAGNPAGNGIVDVDTPDGSVLAPYEQDSSFIYPASAFTGLGAGTTTEQSYDAADPFLAGHWLPGNGGVGPQGVAGLASAISGESASGARGFVFGTSVFFRNHVKGGQSQAARALFWAGPDAEEVPAP